MGPTSNDRRPYKKDVGETETQGRRCVKTEAEMGARHPQASQQLGEQREEGRIFP